MNLLFRDTSGPNLAPDGSVVCVGAFDGVHLGHRALLARVHERAAQLGLAPLAISFEPIPRGFFARGAPVPRLTGAREKVGLLTACGARLLLLRFDAKLAALSAEAFIEEVLIERANAREVWIGEDFRFGHARRGDAALLRTLGEQRGFSVAVMPGIEIAGERVSSSTIRAHLAAGEFDAAARLLGRRFTIGGHVVRGRQIGRELGYPTANIRLGRRVAPVGGIFAVRVHGLDQAHRTRGPAPDAGSRGQGCLARPWTAELSNDRRGEAEPKRVWPGVASLGLRPTIGGTEPLLETHVFGFDGDLYGRPIEIEFVQKLRDEEKFDDLHAMTRQIDRDAEQARAILGIADQKLSGVNV
ncbi:MAG: bifunctional riboflavin kinase/FMN adenylyltransferase [Rhodanobacter sp.]|jgi:riboflavin kinase/FMN adenylyltransferase|nr:bifunctional riboflavin kinase/FMN adenylyltransferase [Rhodanobacter sp.]